MSGRPDVRRWGLWGGYALLLFGAPLVWNSGLGHTMLAQIGIAIIACLSYNILFGQGGMLSFGHAVYSGLGAYATIHTLNHVSAGGLPLPVSLLPLVGGLAGLGCAALLGAVTTRKAGTPFAMITLGIGELVWSLAMMLPAYFGGEGGVSGNRVVGPPVWGISFGPQVQVVYLIAVYCFVCTLLMYGLTQTPLGRMLNAVRDNPERVEFIGYSAQQVRYRAFMISGFFAGIAGGLAALNFETVTPEMLGSARSGAYLLFVFIGGAGFFFGPILGAVLMVVSLVLLSEWTQAWLLYLGLAFVWMVVVAPGGLAAVLVTQLQAIGRGALQRLWRLYLGLGLTACTALVGAAAMIEMLYHLQLHAALGPELRFLGLRLNAHAPGHWAAAAAALLLGAAALKLVHGRFRAAWEGMPLHPQPLEDGR